MTPQEQAAFSRGRLQGLREMDEVWKNKENAQLYIMRGREGYERFENAYNKIGFLRQEYSQPN